MCGTAAAASSRSTVMRTISEPARCERRDLLGGAVHVRGVGVGHRLHHDGRAAADLHMADANRNGRVPLAGGCGLGHLGTCS